MGEFMSLQEMSCEETSYMRIKMLRGLDTPGVDIMMELLSRSWYGYVRLCIKLCARGTARQCSAKALMSDVCRPMSECSMLLRSVADVCWHCYTLWLRTYATCVLSVAE